MATSLAGTRSLSLVFMVASFASAFVLVVPPTASLESTCDPSLVFAPFSPGLVANLSGKPAHVQWLTLAQAPNLTLVAPSDIDPLAELEASGILTDQVIAAAFAQLSSHDDEDEEQPDAAPGRAALPRSAQTTKEG